MRPRDNPFRTERIEALSFRFLEGQWEQLWARLERCRGRGAIVGPRGSGKTTLLAELGDRFSQRGLRPRRLRAPLPGEPSPAFFRELATVSEADALLIDGAERLSFWPWRRLLAQAARAGALVVTRHRPGQLPTLLTTRTSPDLLAVLVADLLEGDDRTVDAGALFGSARGDLRKALLTLYDRWASR